MKKKIVALLLTLVMLVGIIPAAVYASEGAAKVTLTVTPEKEVVLVGEEVTFSIRMTTDEALASMAFVTDFADGLTYVDGSGAIDANAKATFSLDDIAWTEWGNNENYVNGYGASPVAGDAVVCSFKATASNVGEYEIGLKGLDEFCDTAWNVFDASDIKVVSTPVTVVDHFCADHAESVEGADATCDEEGTLPHYACTYAGCNKKYKDAAATEELAKDEDDNYVTSSPATGHSEYDWVVVTEATCTAEGLKVLKCKDCDDVKESEVIAKAEHDCEWVTIVEGNCVTAGLKELTCKVCGFVKDTETSVASGSHTYVVDSVKEPTATRPGYTTYKCEGCGDVKVDDETAKVSGKVVLTVANGNNTILTGIVNGDYSASVSVPKGAIIDTKSITAGLTMTDVASLGIKGTKSFEMAIATGIDKQVALDGYLPTYFTGATIGGTIDGVAYKYVLTAENTADAFTVYATPDAGVQPAWHALASHITAESQTADDSFVYVPGKAYVQIGTEKLVFEDGKDGFKLDNIGGDIQSAIREYFKLLNVEELEDAEIEIYLPAGTVIALSNYTATLNDEATITIYGYNDSGVNTIMSELRDSKSSTEIVKTLVSFVGKVATAINGQDVTLNIEFGHEVADWTIIDDATCSAEGYKVKYCVKCGEVVEDAVIEKLVHEYNAVVTEPTCTEKGYTTFTCPNCADSYVGDFVDALDHLHESEVIAPTCEAEGYTLCTCERCGATHETAFVPATGHTKADAVKENEVAPTCTEAGSYDSVVYCSVCKAEISRETVAVAALGHAYKAVVTAPTCEAKGYTTYVCATCGDTYVADYVDALGHTSKWVASADKTGYFNEICTVCGALLSTDNLTGLEISDEYVKTKYVRKAPAFTLTAEILPKENADLGYSVVWSSSNEKVATVDEDGNVTTHHLGTATIYATLVDAEGNEVYSEGCVVEVYYTFCQWLIWFFLIGCAWYFV